MNISIKITENHFVLSGDTNVLIHNRRAKISLRRLRYKIKNKNILIPFEGKTQIYTLQDIE